MVFYDKIGNRFYIDRDKLYVDLVKFNRTRLIGSLSTTLSDKSLNLTVHRKSSEKFNVGYFVSLLPIQYLNINRIVLIVDNQHVYMTTKEALLAIVEGWRYTPTEGYEEQIILNPNLMEELKPSVRV